MNDLLNAILVIPDRVKAFFKDPVVNATLRVFFFRGMIILTIGSFIWLGGWLFEPVDWITNIDPVQSSEPPPLFNHNSARYLLMPLIAIFFVLVSGARYVKDIYALKLFRHALEYITASMFGFYYESVREIILSLFLPIYPKLTIDDGKMVIPKGKINLLDKIGGPGYVMIQPGNAVSFNFFRHPSRMEINRSVFLEPFERIGPIINLDDQEGAFESVEAMTRDGIKVRVKDIHYRYRIIYRQDSQRRLGDPYPFDDEALRRRAANTQVNDYGLVPWQAQVSMSVKSALVNYINSHHLDFLTARKLDQDNPQAEPRQDFRDNMLTSPRVWSVGAELLWIDAGHIEIARPEVEEQRVDHWAVKWKGEDKILSAKAKSTSSVLGKLDRAELRALMINKIASELEWMNLSGNTPDNMRRIFLNRVASILEKMADSKP